MKILVVDDDPLMHATYRVALKGHELKMVTTSDDAEILLEQEPFQAALLDIELKVGSTGDGISVLKKIREKDNYLPCIMVSGLDDPSTIEKCLELGAVDYIVKGMVQPEAFALALFKAALWKKDSAANENRRTTPELRLTNEIHQIKGTSQATKELRESIGRLGKLAGPFLIVGNTGTGKELVARGLWSAQGTKRPFVAVNCASLPENLVESELFGYERGAFTGAISNKTGLFEAANGGDIFLDEIGELSLNLQAKLLRVLQEKKVRRLGSDKERPVDFRIIAATNVNMLEAVQNKTFREDLFYRLNVYQMRLTPLNERKEDVSELLNHFFHMNGLEKTVIDPEAQKLIQGFNWPGNVRQLKAFADYLLQFLFGSTKTVTKNHVEKWLELNELKRKPIHTISDAPGEEVTSAIKQNQTIDVVKKVEDYQKAFVMAAIKGTKNRSAAARVLGVSRQRMSNWLTEWGIFDQDDN